MTALIATEKDPYTLVLNELVSVLFDYHDFADLVERQNVVTFTGHDRSPVKEQVSESDLPEVRILLTGSQPGQHASSQMYGETTFYEIQVSSGDRRLDAKHNPLRWLVFRAMRQCEERLKALLWSEKSFVVRAQATQVSEGTAQSDLNRGIIGWAAIWVCRVKMQFETADL